jgi:hypothetical protein
VSKTCFPRNRQEQQTATWFTCLSQSRCSEQYSAPSPSSRIFECLPSVVMLAERSNTHITLTFVKNHASLAEAYCIAHIQTSTNDLERKPLPSLKKEKRYISLYLYLSLIFARDNTAHYNDQATCGYITLHQCCSGFIASRYIDSTSAQNER